METSERIFAIPYVAVTKVTLVRADGTSSPIYMDVSGEPLPRGTFEADSAPEIVKRAVGGLGKDAVRFEVTDARIPRKGTARGI